MLFLWLLPFNLAIRASPGNEALIAAFLEGPQAGMEEALCYIDCMSPSMKRIT